MIYFYTIDLDYLSKLYEVDSEVYYNLEKSNYNEKPYIGIIITCDEYKYFIPLTSGKEKHKRLKNTGIDYLLIYEYVQKENLGKNDIYVELNALDNKNKVKKILSVLDFKKAIPVCENCYKKMEVDKHMNRDLLNKEYKFLKRKSEMIENKMRRIINDQKSTGNVKYKYCDFTKLEKKCDELKEKYSNDCIK